MAKFLLLFCVFALSSLLAAEVQCRRHHRGHHATFNVVDFGAIGDGSTDDTQAFKKTWKATCSSSRKKSPTMHVPSGYTFLLQPLSFEGPCKSDSVHVVINGDLTAPRDYSEWNCGGGGGGGSEGRTYCEQWIQFHELNGLYLSGSGTINGQGSDWWSSFCKDSKKPCRQKPTGLVIAHSNNVHMRGLHFRDNPQMHIAIERSTWVYAAFLTITAPEHSHNTDGIHIQHSQNIFIEGTTIGTGDDCISIGDGSSQININNVTCGPGHGISIGSLGIKGRYETVEDVRVSNVDFTGTSNGVRIKTWQGGRGFARNIVFERINSHGSKHPIIIDQFYCDHQRCKNDVSAVQVSNVTYSHIYGTSKEEAAAVKFACSESVPCKDIFMNHIDLHSTDDVDRSTTKSECQNVQGSQYGDVFPSVPCLSVLTH